MSVRGQSPPAEARRAHRLLRGQCDTRPVPLCQGSQRQPSIHRPGSSSPGRSEIRRVGCLRSAVVPRRKNQSEPSCGRSPADRLTAWSPPMASVSGARTRLSNAVVCRRSYSATRTWSASRNRDAASSQQFDSAPVRSQTVRRRSTQWRSWRSQLECQVSSRAVFQSVSPLSKRSRARKRPVAGGCDKRRLSRGNTSAPSDPSVKNWVLVGRLLSRASLNVYGIVGSDP